MKKLSFLVLVFLSIHSFCMSQKIIELSTDVDPAGNLNFYCVNHDLCKYSIVVDFSQMYNLLSDYTFPHKFDVDPGKTQLFILKRKVLGTVPSYMINFKTIKGGLNPKVNREFVYLLPVGNGKVTESYEFKYIPLNNKDTDPKDWYVVGLSMKFKDTVYAARGGIVTDASDTTRQHQTANSSFRNEYSLEIYHNDGTFGKYMLLNTILVKIGQQVIAGDPIGLVGGDEYDIGPHASFSVEYNYEIPAGVGRNKGKSSIYERGYLPIVFYTKESKNIRLIPDTKYTADYPETIITQEMSKRQIKMRGKKYSNI